MSYIDPKSGQNGAFQNWVKTLTKTFLDLFVRLAIIFFVILVVRSIADDIAAGNFKTFDFSTPVGAFATIFIIIGLFFFAKQAPQFIYEALGMKYDKGAGIFSGLGKIAATGMALGGSIGSASTSLRASHEAGDGRALTIGKTALGGARGFLNGLGAATSAKDHPTQAVREAQAKRNARVAELAENGGSVLGAIGATAQQVFTGTSPGDRLEAEWKAEEEKIKYERQKNAERKRAMDRANSKGVESLATSGTIKAKAGTQLYKYNGLKANASSFRSAISAAKSGGSYTMYSDSSGRLLTENQYSVLSADERSGFAEGKYMDWEGMHINMKDADLLAHEFDDANIADYYEQALSGRLDDSVIIDANTRFAEANGGVGLETEFGGATGLKASFGSVGSDLDNRELALANEKNSKKAKAAKANANYYKANRK